jgi:hypothetical protein
MLAHGTQSSIVGKVEVGVIIQLQLKHRHKNITKPHANSSESKYSNLYKSKQQ